MKAPSFNIRIVSGQPRDPSLIGGQNDGEYTSLYFVFTT